MIPQFIRPQETEAVQVAGDAAARGARLAQCLFSCTMPARSNIAAAFAMRFTENAVMSWLAAGGMRPEALRRQDQHCGVRGPWQQRWCFAPHSPPAPPFPLYAREYAAVMFCLFCRPPPSIAARSVVAMPSPWCLPPMPYARPCYAQWR